MVFTKQEKEKICEEVYDWTTSAYLTPTWKSLDEETKKRILKKVDIYLDAPKNEGVLKRIFEKFDPEAIEEFNNSLPHPLMIAWK